MAQEIYLSTKITVKIPNDPIFSGVYTFERNQITNKWDLLSSSNPLSGPSWPDPSTNTLLFNTSIPKHSGIYFNNQYLIKLDSIFDGGSAPSYPGYIETLAKYNSISSEAGITYEDAFVWPAHFVMTAISPPECPDCTYLGAGETASRPTGYGHRLVAGFCLPIRYRELTQNWIVVDYPNQPEPIRYHPLSGINDSNISYFNYATGVPIFVNNSGLIRDFKTTNDPAFDPNPDSLFDFSESPPPQDLQPICTGIQDAIGFAFKCSATGFGFSSVSNIGGAGNIDGYGGLRNNFYSPPTTDPTAQYDANGQFFNQDFYMNKQSVTASVKFYYSCRVGVPCDNLFAPDPPHTVTGTLCLNNSQVYANAQCNGTAIDTNYINNYNDNTNLNIVDIFYTGPSGFCPCVRVPETPIEEYTIYESVNQETLKVKIPYSGPLDYDSIFNWIKTEFKIIRPFDVAGSQPLGLLQNITDINNLCYTQYPFIDLTWNFQSLASSGNILIKISDIRIRYPKIVVSGSNDDLLNGDYIWSENHQAFIKKIYSTDPPVQLINSLIIKRVNESYLTDVYNYALGSGAFSDCNSKIPSPFTSLYFLANTGISLNMTPLLDTQEYHIWSNDSPKTYGLSPPPSSIAIF